jgi:hypothetical protein
MSYGNDLDSYERDEVLTKLNTWASGHQTPRQAFMTLMGRTFSPIEFYELVSRALWDAHTGNEEEAADLAFGRGFVRYLQEQSQRCQEPLTASLERAIRANQVQR